MSYFLVHAALLIAFLAHGGTAHAAKGNGEPMTQSGDFICQTSCQFWDEFRKTCMYRTSCLVEGNTVTFTQCQEWDEFRRQCRNESVTRRNLQFPPWGGSPACTESCQFADFRGACKYRTKCALDEHCARLTSCNVWDEFREVCLDEMTALYCNL